MLTPDFIIDTVQETKRVITNHFIKDETLNKAAQEYINAQAAFAKMLSKNTINITKHGIDCVSKTLFPRPVEVTKAARAKAAKAETAAARADTNTQGEENV